ncbi:MAG TPA: hypothetical protein VGL83_04655 [Stellaceae bacterium]
MRRFSKTGGLLALLAAALLLLGLPRLIDTALVLATATTASDPAAARREAASLEGIDRWWHDPFARIRAATLRFQSAAGTPGADPAEIERAIDDFQSGLARAPADPQAWLLLALARYQDHDLAGAQLAWRSSVLIAPYAPALLLARAETALKLWPALDPDDRQLAEEQIRMAADHQFDGLVALARASEDPTPIMNALDGDPDRAAALAAALRQK